MDLEVSTKIRALQRMTVGELLVEWERLYGEPTRTRNKAFLFKRLAWEVQRLKYGGLSDAAKQRLKDLAPTSLAFVRTRRPDHFDPTAILAGAPSTTPPQTKRDPRSPVPGSVISKRYKGRELRVTVRDASYEFEGAMYSSLTALARAITGSKNINGKLFFGLTVRNR